MGAVAHGLAEWEIDLQKAADTVVEQGKKVVGQGCLNIKRDAQRIVRAAGHRGYLPHYPYAITYEVRADGGGIVGEIGPENDRLQGGLGRLIENGSRNNAPIPHLAPALDAEVPQFERYVAELGASLLEGQPTPDGPVTDQG